MDYVIHFLIDTHTFYENISEGVRVKHSDALFYKKVTQSVMTKIFKNFGPFWTHYHHFFGIVWSEGGQCLKTRQIYLLG